MTTFGIDYEGGLSGAQVRQAGAAFVCRYLSDFPPKNLTKIEYDDMKAHEVEVVVVWETVGTRSLDGFAAGQFDAGDALEQARAIGIPEGRPIFFAVDFDEPPGDVTAVLHYFQGVVSILGKERTGVYGGYWAVKRLFDEGVVGYGWQTYAWSGGNWDERAKLRQYSNGHTIFGIGVDFDKAMADDYGQVGFEPKPPEEQKDPTGTANAIISIDFDKSPREWELVSKPGTFKPGREGEKHEIKITFDGKDGSWTK